MSIPGFGDSNSVPSPVAAIQEQVTKITGASAGLVSGDNAVGQALQPIQRIASKAQTFIDKSLMGRGLTVQRFSAAKPGKNWSQNFPYRFLVTRVNSQGKHSVVAEYRLPINPQELTITTPFAIKTTVTSRGILEEHNGIPIKQINLSGSTGVYIDRESGGREQKRTSVLGTIFGGTLDATNNALSQVKTAGAALGFGSSNLSSQQEAPELTRTGYYQYRMLDLFLTTYGETKAAPGNQDLRLIFEIAKSNVAYIVTPLTSVEKRTAASPMEHLYSIQLLAWATVPDFRGAAPTPTSLLINQDVGDLRRALNTLSQLRKTVTAFKNIVSAVRADVESNIFGPINQVILLAKDTLSIPLAIADLPKSLRDSFQTSVAASWQALSRTNEDLKDLFNSDFQSIINEGSGSNSYLGASKAQAGGDAAPTNMFKSDVLDNLDLTANVQVNQLQLNNNQQNAVDAAINDAKDITVNEVKDLIAQLQSLSDALEPTISLQNAMDEEWDLLYALSDSVTELYGVISNGQLNNSANTEDQGLDDASLATTAQSFWEQSTVDSGIGYTAPLGKFSVPFPFGASLEQLAFTYLGDVTRWMEIVSLNGLQAPYIDEDGFTYSFIGNGSENQINIESSVNLYVGQSVFISSNTQLTTKRKVQSIAQVSDTNFLITVDGEPDLQRFTTQDSAQLLAYLPYTVNSMRQIYIPTDVAPTQDELDTPPITFLDDDIDMIKFSKIDWLLTPQGDLAVTKDGFMNLAFGKTNLLQAAKMKLITKPGGLILHPEFGAGVEIGTSFADVNLDDTAKRIDQNFRNDPRFLAPASINLQASPTVLQESVVAVVAKDNGILPIQVPLTK